MKSAIVYSIGKQLTYLNTDLECSALNMLSQSLGWTVAILATQVNYFVPTVFPEKAHYVQMIIQDNTNPPEHVTLGQLETLTVPADVSHLLGKPPLEYLWKVMFSAN